MTAGSNRKLEHSRAEGTDETILTCAVTGNLTRPDLNTMTFGNETIINTPRNVRIMAQAIYDCGAKPEIELFDSGDIELARDMFADGSPRTPATASLVLDVSYGIPPPRRACCTRAIACRRVWPGLALESAAPHTRCGSPR